MPNHTPCVKADGSPKHAYGTYAEAFAEASKHHGAYRVYPCKQHGFHIGGTVSRALRSALTASKHRRRA